MKFKDYFSQQSAGYARYRPQYPRQLFEWLARQAPGHTRAWDCACGSGQASRQLAGHFDVVLATDASASQVVSASGPDNVRYSVAAAERSGIAAHSVDMICVAQALHWFDVGCFYAEAARVARPGAVLSVWTYGSIRVEGIESALLEGFEHGTVGPYWPAERSWVDSQYADVTVPGSALDVPQWPMTANWTFAQLLGYFDSWSSVQRYRAATGKDPIPALHGEIAAQWGRQTRSRQVSWPLTVLAARLSA